MIEESFFNIGDYKISLEHFVGKGDHKYLTHEWASIHIVKYFNFFQREGRIYQLKNNKFSSLNGDKLKTLVFESEFKTITKLNFKSNLKNNLLGEAPTLPELNQNAINFNDVCAISKKDTFEFTDKIVLSKINVNIDFEIVKEFPEWEEFVTKYWHNDIKDINRIFSSLFWTKEFVQRRRSIVIWDSLGDAGKSELFNRLENKFQNKFNRNGLQREYNGKTQGTMEDCKNGQINIIDDVTDFKITNDFAKDQTKHKFTIKNIGEFQTSIESYFTTIILCNGLNDKITEENARKRFDYVKTNNERIDSNNEMSEAFDYILDNLDKLLNYLFYWLQTNYDYVLKVNNPIKEETFETNELYERFEEELLESPQVEINWKEIKLILNKISRDTLSWKNNDYIKFLRKNEEELSKTYICKFHFKLNADNKATNVPKSKIIKKEYADLKNNTKIVPKENKLPKNVEPNKGDARKLKSLGLIEKIVKQGKFYKYILSDDAVVLDIEPIDNKLALDNESKDYIANMLECKLYSYTNGGIHAWFKSDKEYEAKQILDTAGIIVEVKTKDIFVKNNLQGDQVTELKNELLREKNPFVKNSEDWSEKTLQEIQNWAEHYAKKEEINGRNNCISKMSFIMFLRKISRENIEIIINFVNQNIFTEPMEEKRIAPTINSAERKVLGD